MNPSPLQLAELHENSPKNVVDMDNYFTSKNYFAYKRKKQVMRARIEQEIENDRNNRISSLQ
jgi:hypothetical protein